MRIGDAKQNYAADERHLEHSPPRKIWFAAFPARVLLFSVIWADSGPYLIVIWVVWSALRFI